MLPPCCLDTSFRRGVAADSCGSRRDRAAPLLCPLVCRRRSWHPGPRARQAPRRGGRTIDRRSMDHAPMNIGPARLACAAPAGEGDRGAKGGPGARSPAWRRPSGPSPMVPGGCSPPTDGAALDLDRRRGRGGRGHLIPVIHSAGLQPLAERRPWFQSAFTPPSKLDLNHTRQKWPQPHFCQNPPKPITT